MDICRPAWCPPLARSGHHNCTELCPVSEVKRHAARNRRGVRRVFSYIDGLKADGLGLFMKFTTLLVAGSAAVLIALRSSAVVVLGQPTTPPAIAPASRLTLTAEQEYTIREILKDVNVPKEKSGSETVGDSVPENVKLYALPSVIEQKVPKAQSHKFFIRDDDTIILVSPSDRRIADVLKKKSSD